MVNGHGLLDRFAPCVCFIFFWFIIKYGQRVVPLSIFNMYFFSHLNPLMNKVSICNIFIKNCERLEDEKERRFKEGSWRRTGAYIQGMLLEKKLCV